MWQSLNDILNNLANNRPLMAMIEAFTGGLVLSLSALILKLSKKLTKGERQLLIYMGGVLMSGGTYLLNTPSGVPIIIFIQGLVFYATSQAWWRIFITRAFEWAVKQFTNSLKVGDEVQSALQPVASIEAPAPVAAPIVTNTVVNPEIHTFDH